MVRFQRVNVVAIIREDILLDTLAETILRDGRNNLAAMVFFRSNPTNLLIQREQISRRVQFSSLDHRFANGRGVLLEFGYNGRIIKDSTGDHAVTST